jgi:hypothetical protein
MKHTDKNTFYRTHPTPLRRGFFLLHTTVTSNPRQLVAEGVGQS